MDKLTRWGAGYVALPVYLCQRSTHSIGRLNARLSHTWKGDRQTGSESGERGLQEQSLQLGPPRRHFNFMFLPLPDNVLLCLAICVCLCVCPWCAQSSSTAHVVAALPGLVATDAAIRIAIQMRRAHPFLRMNCKTPHIFHVIVCLPANWSVERGYGVGKEVYDSYVEGNTVSATDCCCPCSSAPFRVRVRVVPHI